jgi:phosphonopyruvate decarboxylase
VLLDNGAHDSTGGQATVSAQVSFASVAAACGYASAVESDDLFVLDELFASPALDGPRFVRVAIRRGTPEGLPRHTITPHDVKTRLRRHIGTAQGVQ